MVLAACTTESSEDKAPDYSFGESLSLSGSVYTRDIGINDIDIDSLGGDGVDIGAIITLLAKLTSSTELDKNIALTISDSGLGGSGEIKNGNMSYSIGKPETNALLPLGIEGIAGIEGIYTTVDIQPSGVSAAFLSLAAVGSADYHIITKEKISFIIGTVTIIVDAVSYVYVDQDVTITAQGNTYSSDDLIGFPVNLTTGDISLNLKKGWNTLHSTITIIPDLSNIIEQGYDGLEFNGTVNILTGNPSLLRWVLTPID